MSDLTSEWLDKLAQWIEQPGHHPTRAESRALIAMARAKQAAERERDALRKAGQALVECILSDDFTEEATPQHDCGYLTDAAGCSFHERFWGAVETLHPTYGLDEEGLDEYEAALAQSTDAGGA